MRKHLQNIKKDASHKTKLWPASFWNPDRLCCMVCLFHPNAHTHFKPIPINSDLEGSALELCEALGDGEAEAAAFGGAGDVSADESLSELFALHI